MVRIAARGVVIGPADGPLEWKFFAEPRRADEAWYFLRTYAPFEERTGEGEVSFRGRGKARAGATEQRMILEWARQVAAESAGGRAGSAYGLVLGWHQGGSSGVCSDVVVYLAGEAVATSCGWEGEVHSRLDPGALGRLYAWFDRLQAFQMGSEIQQGPNPRTGALDTRLIFAGQRPGQGGRPATAAEQQEIQAFAATLFAELAARKTGAPPAPAPEAPGEKTAAEATSAGSARLLLPPSAASPKPEEVPLQLPEKPPPPPKPAASAPPPPGTPGR